MEIHINRKYKIMSKLGKGSYGEIFAGKDLKNGLEVAVKLEPHNIPTPMLSYESNVLNAVKNQEGFPQKLWFGS
jgi:serine/threonine protein kinase